jgi:hypothetical protein
VCDSQSSRSFVFVLSLVWWPRCLSLCPIVVWLRGLNYETLRGHVCVKFNDMQNKSKRIKWGRTHGICNHEEIMNKLWKTERLLPQHYKEKDSEILEESSLC